MSNAIKGANAKFQVATAAGSPKTITGITKANPAIVTATAHGLTQGQIIVIDGCAGMIEVNGRAFVVDLTATGASPQTNKFALKGVDSSAYTTWTSGGTATPQTMTSVGGVLEVGGFSGSSAEIDVTQIDSTAKEFVMGLQDFGDASLRIFISPSDVGQAKMRSLRSTAAAAAYAVILGDGSIAAFMAYVRQFSFSNVTADGAVQGQVTLRITKEPCYFA